MFYSGTQADKLQRRYRRFYAADGSMEITFDALGNKTTFVTYMGGDAYGAPAIWHSEQGSATTEQYFYLFRNYLGSILAITDSAGAIKEKRHFDAWGEIAILQDGAGNALSSFTILDRGYTGHEHLLGVGLVHMNGRLYDPKLHRFLMPDNFVQDPYNTQNFNRYGYVLNNPLSYTDPSGEFFLIDDLIAGVIGGVINLAVNIIQGNITGSFWEVIGKGAAAFGAGFGAGVLSLYGPAGWAAGGALVGGTNAWLSGTDVLEGTLTGAFSGLVGGQFGKWAGQLGGVAINGIKTQSPILQGIIGGSVGGAIGGGATGFTMALIGGASFDDALQAGLQQGKTGFVIGGIAGGGSAYAYSKANNINPFNGKSLGYKGDDSNYEFARRLQKNKGDFFEGKEYSEKAKLDFLKSDNHSFPEEVRGFQGDGVIKNIRGNDGVFKMLEIKGVYKGSNGYFQFMLDKYGNINHRFFYRPKGN